MRSSLPGIDRTGQTPAPPVLGTVTRRQEATFRGGLDVFTSVSAGCWLNAIGGTITVGDGCSFAGDVTISAVASVMLGRDVLVARGVHIGDHDHAFTDPGRPARRQGIANAAPVMIGDGAWLGHNVTVTAGVSIGRGAVIAAGAVVTRDVPPYSLAVGIPARVVRSWAPVTAPP